MPAEIATTDPPATAGPAPMLIDTAGAAAILGISESHFFGLLREGKLGPAAVRLGRCRRYRVDELRRWVEAGCPAKHRWQTMSKGH